MFGMVGRLFAAAMSGQNWPRVGVKRKLKITETLLPNFA
jgi:hypothetical protein